MIVLDGLALAAKRAPLIAARGDVVRRRRGRPPLLLLVAFAGDGGRAPHVRGKLRACGAVGVAVLPLIVPSGDDTAAVVRGMDAAIAAHAPDGVFVQIPAPPHLDEAAITAAIPAAADVDIMTPARVARYMASVNAPPPVTIAAALLLLDEHDVALAGRSGVVVADASPFTAMLIEALRRRGVIDPVTIEPRRAAGDERLRGAALVVAATGIGGLIRAADLSDGCVALDFGYFNEGGRGDIDVTAHVAHLAALMPVPGGVGPMTVSVLVERVVSLAERAPA